MVLRPLAAVQGLARVRQACVAGVATPEARALFTALGIGLRPAAIEGAVAAPAPLQRRAV
jgi:hypothetical protein